MARYSFAQKTDYKTALDILQTIKAEDYPESATIAIYNKEVTIDQECLGITENESYIKILTEKGKRSSSRVFFFYDSNYDTVVVENIEIIKPDGSVEKFDPSEILKKISQSSLGGFSNIYSSTAWFLTGNIPNIETGDIIHKKYKDIVHKARMKDNFFDRISVQSMQTVYKRYYRLEAPKNKHVNVVEINKKPGMAKVAKEIKGNKTIYTVNYNFIPQIIYEPDMDATDFFAYYIIFTTVDSWEDISKWYYSLVDNHLKVNEAIKNKVAELTKDTKTRREKVTKIFYWVAQKVRYLGVDKEKNRPGYEPHDVTYTFETRGGVCRDKAALLVAMLREAGVPADPILISAGYRLNHAAPVMWFNHAVAVSYDDKGKPEFFLDPTNETSKDFFPQYEEDNTYIIARKKGADLKIVPVSPPERNNTNVDMEINVDKENNATGSITIVNKGLSDTYVRQWLMGMSPYKRKEMLQRIIKSIHPFALISEYSISDPEDKSGNIVMKASFTIDNFVDHDSDFMFIPYKAADLSLSTMYSYQMHVFSLSERKYPFKLFNTFSVDISQKIVFAKALTNISMPEIDSLNYKGFVLRSDESISADKKEVIAKVSFSSSEIHFETKDYQDLKLRLSLLERYKDLYMIGKIFGK